MIPSQDPLSYLSAFLGGIAISFTPCVYPLLPVTLSFIGASSSGSKLKGLILSLAYVSGIALVYASLGVIAGLTGSLFGAVSVHPATRMIIGVAMVLFGLSMWDILPLNIFASRAKANVKKEGVFKAFLIGITSGFMISPCVSPALGSILVYVASSKNIIYGGTLLLAFAYGMGLILVLAGTFSGILVNLPKSGLWMAWVKKACGLILLAIGLYFIILGARS
ncbi:MAG: cytochrome c biogenesis protein CcdA [Candidatus Omnitrophota bacterium]